MLMCSVPTASSSTNKELSLMQVEAWNQLAGDAHSKHTGAAGGTAEGYCRARRGQQGAA